MITRGACIAIQVGNQVQQTPNSQNTERCCTVHASPSSSSMMHQIAHLSDR